MKKLFLMTLVSIVSVFCTGCVKFSYDIQIDDKDKVTISELKQVKFPPLSSETFQRDLKKDLGPIVSKYIDAGYEVDLTFADKDGNSGFVIKRKGLSFLDASENMPKGFKNNDKNSFVVKRGLLKRFYKLHLVYTLEDAVNEAATEAQNLKLASRAFIKYKDVLNKFAMSTTKTIDPVSGNVLVTTKYAGGNVVLSQYDSLAASGGFQEQASPQAELTIKIPVKATKHNASKVISDTEYKWILLDESQPVEIIIEYEKYDFSTIAMIFSILVIGIGAVLLAQKLRAEDPVQGL